MDELKRIDKLFIASTGKPNKDKITWLSNTMFTMGDGWIREIYPFGSITSQYLKIKED